MVSAINICRCLFKIVASAICPAKSFERSEIELNRTQSVDHWYATFLIWPDQNSVAVILSCRINRLKVRRGSTILVIVLSSSVVTYGVTVVKRIRASTDYKLSCRQIHALDY